jgi:hypothetical protein
MTTGQMILMTVLYLAAFVAAAYFTRAKVRRIAGALAGGAVFAVIGVLAVALGEAQNWWRVPKAHASPFWLLLWLGLAVSCSPVYLITWRVARRFGGRGLAVCALVSGIIGPPRDYFYAATFPSWMVFSLGITPVVADATIYVLLVVVGHGVMRMFAGPAQDDSLRTGGPGIRKHSLRPLAEGSGCRYSSAAV